MGLFSNLRGKPATIDTSVARGMLALPLITAAADGSVDRSEIDEIVTLCSQNPIFQKLGAPATVKLLEDLAGDLKRAGGEAVFVEAVNALSPKLRETALCFAIRIAVADGTMDRQEIATLVAMGERMGIPEEQFGKIIEVLMMLHRGEAAA